MTASVITLFAVPGLASHGIAKLKLVRDAPQELRNLMEQISALEISLANVSSAAYQLQETTSLVHGSLNQLVDRAKSRLLDLDKMVHYSLSSSRVDRLTGIKARRITWMKEKSKVQEFLAELSQLQISIIAVLSASHL